MEGEASGQREPDTVVTRAEPLAAGLLVTRTRAAPSWAEAGETVTRGRDAPLGGEDGGATELARGASIGRYVVLDKLGAGAMGVVYCAFDPELDRKVAIKLLRPEASGSTLSESQAARARLLREA